jgi:hypothetical protein
MVERRQELEVRKIEGKTYCDTLAALTLEEPSWPSQMSRPHGSLFFWVGQWLSTFICLTSNNDARTLLDWPKSHLN